MKFNLTKRLLSLMLYLSSTVSAVSVAATAAPPYPQSKVITGVSWDLSTVKSLRKAAGSDIWPTAWAADGNLYGAWGGVPIRVGGSRSEGLIVRLHELAVPVLQLRVGDVVLLGVGVLDVADG